MYMNIKDIKQYNVEAIKSIYKEDLLESESHSNDYILNNYFYNHIYFNSIESSNDNFIKDISFKNLSFDG